MFAIQVDFLLGNILKFLYPQQCVCGLRACVCVCVIILSQQHFQLPVRHAEIEVMNDAALCLASSERPFVRRQERLPGLRRWLRYISGEPVCLSKTAPSLLQNCGRMGSQLSPRRTTAKTYLTRLEMQLTPPRL